MLKIYKKGLEFTLITSGNARTIKILADKFEINRRSFHFTSNKYCFYNGSFDMNKDIMKNNPRLEITFEEFKLLLTTHESNYYFY